MLPKYIMIQISGQKTCVAPGLPASRTGSKLYPSTTNNITVITANTVQGEQRRTQHAERYQYCSEQRHVPPGGATLKQGTLAAATLGAIAIYLLICEVVVVSLPRMEKHEHNDEQRGAAPVRLSPANDEDPLPGGRVCRTRSG